MKFHFLSTFTDVKILALMGKLIMIASGKGGSGTTSFTTNLSVVLADTGAQVLVCDMNIGLRNDDIYLGMENSVLFDLGDVLSGVCSVEKAIIPSDFNNLSLLPCPQCKSVPGLTSANLSNLFDELKGMFDYILVDCPVSIGKSLEYVASKADTALLVVTPDFVSVRNTDAVSRRLENLGLEKRCFVLNKVTEQSLKHEPQFEWIAQTLDIPLVGILSYDEEINFCNNRGVPIVAAGSSFYVKTFIEIAARIVA